MRVAVVGAGIGGLTLAIALRRAGVTVEVYERAEELREVGAAVALSANGTRELTRLGVGDALDRVSTQPTELVYRDGRTGERIAAHPGGAAYRERFGAPYWGIHRVDLQQTLAGAVDPEYLHLGRGVSGVTDVGHGATITFDDGSTTTADVVVGADGVHSTVRGAVTAPSPARNSGLCAYRAIVPAHRAPAFARRHAQTLWIGPGHHLVHYPISGGEAVNLVAIGPAGDAVVESWSATATVGELLAEFAGWDRRLGDLIRQAGLPGRWALLDREPLRRWSRGPVTLLGDAAHPMFPFFAQGAAQAIEDAAVLTRCLAADTQSPARALQRYESLRIGRTTRLQEISHGRAHVNHLPDGPEQQARDLSLAAADPLTASAWIYAYDALG